MTTSRSTAQTTIRQTIQTASQMESPQATLQQPTVPKTTFTQPQLKYLQLLAREFPNSAAAKSEIINLQTILTLPRGTDHFVSDIHGEHEAFLHILNNCSGVIREQIRVIFGDKLSQEECAQLRTLIYYPAEKLERAHKAGITTKQWYIENLTNLVILSRWIAGKYTRSKVRKAMPPEYAYIIDELMHATRDEPAVRHLYHQEILRQIIATNAADDLICALSALIKHLAVAKLHVVGDIFDRGPHADKIIHDLAELNHFDIQWGNHDIAWMGAACGSLACICSVVRTCVRYNTLAVLESAYGISLRSLALFAQDTYHADDTLSPLEKAIDVILFKVEAQTFLRHPDWQMSAQRVLLNKIDIAKGTVCINGINYALTTIDFPTLDPQHPFDLTPAEAQVLNDLQEAFAESDRLHRHVAFLYEHGSIYTICNEYLLFHGCVPMTATGDFARVSCLGEELAGRAYLDFCDEVARRAWKRGTPDSLDWMYYLWCGAHSPLSGRVVKTFERAFVQDRAAWAEPRDPYYDLTDSFEYCLKVLAEFGLYSEDARIVNGHTPVKAAQGESPVRARGKKLIIDGGFCKAYQAQTGIAGYTLVAGSHDVRIKAHRPFLGVEAALDDNADIFSDSDVIKRYDHQVLVAETDAGKTICEKIADLQQLLFSFEAGLITEHS